MGWDCCATRFWKLPITATGFDATVWTFVAQRGTPIPDKGRPTGKSEYRNKSYPLFLTVERQSDAPPLRQSGPNTFGTQDVFGNWKTVDWHVDRLGAANPLTCHSDGKACVTTDILSAPSYPGGSDEV